MVGKSDDEDVGGGGRGGEAVEVGVWERMRGLLLWPPALAVVFLNMKSWSWRRPSKVGLRIPSSCDVSADIFS